MRTYQIAVIALVVLVLGAVPAWAGAPTEQLRGHVDEVVRILDDPAQKDKPAERRARVRKIAEDIFDYPDTARRALGAHWNGRTPQEREEFAQGAVRVSHGDDPGRPRQWPRSRFCMVRRTVS